MLKLNSSLTGTKSHCLNSLLLSQTNHRLPDNRWHQRGPHAFGKRPPVTVSFSDKQAPEPAGAAQSQTAPQPETHGTLALLPTGAEVPVEVVGSAAP